MAQQMVLGFPVEVDYSVEAFMPLPSNQPLRDALAHLTQRGQGHLAVLGGQGTGKSHALHLAARLLGVAVTAADAVDATLLEPPHAVIDDVEALSAEGQEILFHILQRPRGCVVLSMGVNPQRMTGLPDLVSRLRVIPPVILTPFDDQTLELMALKLVGDAQLVIRPDVMSYLLRHAQRSPAALATLVKRLDVLSLQEKRAVTLPLVKKVLHDAF